jgi:hypothetical protein
MRAATYCTCTFCDDLPKIANKDRYVTSRAFNSIFKRLRAVLEGIPDLQAAILNCINEDWIPNLVLTEKKFKIVTKCSGFEHVTFQICSSVLYRRSAFKQLQYIPKLSI